MKKILLIVAVVLFGMNINAQDTEKKPFKPTIKFNGRIQYDFAFVSAYDDNTTDKDWLNANEFRRAYISAKGKVGNKISYKAEFELAGSKIGYRDVYLKYDGGKLGSLAFGSVAEATGLNMSTSSKYITFMERSMLTSFQNFRWQSGFHYANTKLFGGKATFQMALTGSGDHHAGFKDLSLEDGMNFTARATTTLMNDKDAHKVVHLGVNFDSRPGKNVKFRTENHVGSKYALGFASDKRSDIGFEVATTFGPLSIQGEYKMNNSTVDVVNKTFKTNSFYVFASYFITGEHRPYKKGTFGRVKPKNDVDNGGMGALEVAVRYSAVDNTDFKSYVGDSNYDKVNNITFGLNWYLNAHARVMYNYVATDLNGIGGDIDSNGDPKVDKKAAHMFRVALDF
jgi:phosphate-selective porin OprO/OprP